ASQAQLDRGYRLVELLKQGQNQPLPVEEEVIVIYAGVKGFVDKIPTEEVRQFEQVLRTEFKTGHPEVLEHIRTTGTMPDEAEIDEVIKQIAASFAGASEEETQASSDEESSDERAS
ncbi:MAG: F0F1 ATP synthase subunit alpha, partial [Acidimicrobiales bacterium]